MYLLCSLSVSVFAQNDKQKITGIVYNENKEPLPGVVVRIKQYGTDNYRQQRQIRACRKVECG